MPSKQEANRNSSNTLNSNTRNNTMTNCMPQGMQTEMSLHRTKAFSRTMQKKDMGIRVWVICSVSTLTKDIPKMTKGRKIRMTDWNTKPKFQFHSKEVCILRQLSLTTSRFMTTENPTNPKMRITLSEANRQVVTGSTTIPTKRDTMALSLLCLSTSSRAKKPKQLKRMNPFGCNRLF